MNFTNIKNNMVEKSNGQQKPRVKSTVNEFNPHFFHQFTCIQRFADTFM